MTILAALQERCINGTIKLNSKRLVGEISTFVHNPQTGKIAATKGEHDDAIMASCIALYIRDSILRDLPMGAVVPKELTDHTKNASYEEIKNEIMELNSKDFYADNLFSRKNPIFSPDEEMSVGIAWDFRRRLNDLLQEFGW